MRKIPSTMSTQHPDNATLPPWIRGEIIAGEDEVHEVYFAFKELKCEEQMWDWEGKDVDPNVLRKLLVNHPNFFREHVLGKDFFITYRVPNPSVEAAEKKVLIEALESIPRCYDVAESFYGNEVFPPIFEVILPLTTSHLELLRVESYYREIIVGKEKMRFSDVEEVSVHDWVGSFQPKNVEIIPLIEDWNSLLHIDQILSEYIKISKPTYVRVFLARSDPALNYGLIPAVLLVKIALSKIRRTSEIYETEMFPIIGTGSLPFRGHLTPNNVSNFVEEYAGVRTVTVQSALKYDFNEHATKETVTGLNKELRKSCARTITEEEERLIRDAIDIFRRNYQRVIEKLAPIINYVSGFVPSRRARKLHIGLFGYSRQVGRTQLPRAIRFTAAMYSLGLPPELIGAGALAKLPEKQWKLMEKYYIHWKTDLSFAAEFLCWQNLNYLMGEKEIVENVTEKFKLQNAIPHIMEDLENFEQITGIHLGPKKLAHRKHANTVNNILLSLAEGNEKEMRNYIVEAAKIRCSLG
jgi:phosphoenolpyruvate carboxylase